jgi:hypothetical protein
MAIGVSVEHEYQLAQEKKGVRCDLKRKYDREFKELLNT